MNYKYMSRIVFSFILAALLLTGALIVLQAMPVDASQARPQDEALFAEGVSLLSADEDGISFVLNSSQIESLAEDLLSSEALNTAIQEPGAPELPYFSTYIAVPPEGCGFNQCGSRGCQLAV